MAKNGTQDRIEKEALKKDYEMQLTAARQSRSDKLTQALEYLKAEVSMVGDKYLTVNGFMQAMSTISEVFFRDHNLISAEGTREMARSLAIKMSRLAKSLAERLEDEDVDTIDESFLDELLDENFILGVHTTSEIVDQLLIVNLLQNIGPSIDDLVQFREESNRAIETLEAALAEVQDSLGVPGQLKVVDAISDVEAGN